MQILVGLGNPGAQYALHRHNVGFMAIDAIAERWTIGPFKPRFQGLAAEGRIDVNQWQSKSRVTARLWHGRQTRGAVVRTLVRGKTVALNGTVVGELGWGRFVAPNPRPYERPFW